MARMASCTDKGTRAPANQDALCTKAIATSLGEASMAVVCDGVGGLALGEVASAHVVRTFSEWFERDLPTWAEAHVKQDQVGLLGLRGVWGRLLARANGELIAYGRAHGGGLGTTFTGVICIGGRYLVGHVGDCRAYLVGAARTERLTQDQTLAAREVALGHMDEREALASRRRSVLLQAVGAQAAGTLRPTFRQGSYGAGDLFVLASDGAWHLQGDAGIDHIFRPLRQADEGELSRACEGLCAWDMAQGERDNLSVACLGPEAPELMEADLESTAALLHKG